MRVFFSGSLTAHSLTEAGASLQAGLGKAPAGVVFDLDALSTLDTSGALFLNMAMDELRARGVRCEFDNLARRHETLLKKSEIPRYEAAERSGSRNILLELLAALGKEVCDGAVSLGSLADFFGRFLISCWALILRPWRMRWISLFFHMERAGLRAVPIVSLLTFLIGLVVAYIGAQQLSLLGADIFAVNLLEVTVLREMGVLITAIVVAGRSSSSFTAQIGAMVANEEVDALRSMGLEPTGLLVVPRVLALLLCLPMLVFIADIMALFGGAVALFFTIDLTFTTFVTQFGNSASVNNFLVGIIKTPFFAIAISLIGCFHGFRATGSAESVGFLTTVSVVQSIFAVILLDALFAIFFSNIGM